MHKHKAGAATDVTGFGILGHAANLASNQKESVDMVLHTLPIIKGMVGIAKTMGNMFQLLQGYSAETSGGLLMSISADGAKAFADEILAIEGQPAWVIGTVETGSRAARIVDSPTIIEV